MTFAAVLRILYLYRHVDGAPKSGPKAASAVASVVGLVAMAYFFYRHRVHCDDLGISLTILEQ